MLISLLVWLIFGAFVGWLAGIIMKTTKTFFGNIVLGIVGSFVGGFIASFLGFGNLGGDYSFNLSNIIISVAGACLVIFIARKLKIGK